MRNKLTIFTVLLLLCCNTVFSDPINKKTALIVANNWMKGKINNSKHLKNNVEIKEITYKEQIVYYIINYGNNSGFVIISGDDSTKPILAYSDKNNFNITNKNNTSNKWLNNYKKFVVQESKNSKSKKTKQFTAEWKWLKNNSAQKKTIAIMPLMDDIRYSQGAGWNRDCPLDAEGPDGRALVGCVATAMGQIMKYWEFPQSGVGSKTYQHSKYGSLSANYQNTIYNWDEMSKDTPDGENAKLLNHCGIAVNMNYGPKSSGAYTTNVVTAFKNFFKYDTSANMIYKYYYSEDEWNTILKNELTASRPVLYRGRSSINNKPAGHLFAIDGFETTMQGDYFHINWGWAGNSNGYFYLTEMITHGGDYNWIEDNAAIINLKPKNIAPKIISSPLTQITINTLYNYTLETYDENKDPVTIELIEAPSWININTVNNTTIVSGTPTVNDIGIHKIILRAKDDILTSEKQEFYIHVINEDQSLETVIIDFETGDYTQANFSFQQANVFNITPENQEYNCASSTINHKESASVTITDHFSSKTNISFDFKTSTEENYDFLTFSIDGEEQGKWSGLISWKTVNFEITPGDHTITWMYNKDYSVSNGDDRVWIDNISYTRIIKDKGESKIIDFETADYSQSDFSFNNNNTEWDLVNKDTEYGYSSKSIAINNNQETSISINKKFDIDTNISFDLKVSSEEIYDFLIFTIDGEEQNRWSGSIPWETVNFNVSNGDHTLTWTYKKDYSVSKNDDCAWLDNITFTKASISKLNNQKEIKEAKNSTKNITKNIITLNQNYPNPATDKTKINFSLSESDHVILEIINNQGIKIDCLIDEKLKTGVYSVSYNTNKLIKGFYFIKLTNSTESKIKKMLVR